VLRKLAVAPATLAIGLATSGWLYFVRPTELGPNVREALPLDELAKHASVSLPWFASVWLAAAVLIGLAARWARIERLTAALLLAVGTWALLYFLNGVSIAITRQIPAREAFHVATRLESVYVPAAIVGLGVAVR